LRLTRVARMDSLPSGLEVNVALTNIFTTLVITGGGGARAESHITANTAGNRDDVTNDAYWRYISDLQCIQFEMACVAYTRVSLSCCVLVAY
jgi:hypothetical protein